METLSATVELRPEFDNIVPEQHRSIATHIFLNLWEYAYSLNPQAPVLTLRPDARMVSLTVGRGLTFRVDQSGQEFWAGISINPVVLSVSERQLLRELSACSEPFVFKAIGGMEYDCYPVQSLYLVWSVAQPAAISFVTEAAKSKSPWLKKHNPELLELIRKLAACPCCGSTRVRPIEYGYPTEDGIRRAARGEIEFGGCCIMGNGIDPRWSCAECHHRWI